MWKEIVLRLLCLRMIISQPVINENIREPRQLDFGECCPCTDLNNKLHDSKVLTSTIVERQDNDDCPCRSSQDSETASSIFRPALRTFDPFVSQSGTNGVPKPLLRPEVSLANSVLQTLHEATNQEYQEAIERDAARNALSDIEDNYKEDAPRNIVNIILKPKEQIDDVIPEASHIQEARLVHPPLRPLGEINKINRLRPQSYRLGDVFLKPKVANNDLVHKKYFDMTNSASNVQEQVLPLKSTFLDDLRLKSDLLKMKLFPNLRHSLKYIQPDNNMFKTNNKFDCENSNNNINFDSNIPQEKEGNKGDGAMPIEDPKQEFIPITQTNIVEKDPLPEDIIKNDCIVQNQLTGDISTESNDMKLLDVVPSPSEIKELKQDATDKYIHEKCDNENYLNEENNSQVTDDGQPQISFEDDPTRFVILNATTNNINEDKNNILIDNIDKEVDPCIAKDSDTDASNNNLVTEIPPSYDIAESIQPGNEENQFMTSETILSKNLFGNNDVNKATKLDSLPNFQANILQTLQNFKLANEDIQDKLRLNVQNVLGGVQLGGLKRGGPESESVTLSSLKDFVTEKNATDKDISVQDLQDMSNRILNLSNISERESDTNTNFDSINKETIIEEKTILPKDILKLSESPFETSKPLLNNNDEIGDANSNNNKNQNNDDNDVMDSSTSKNICYDIETNAKLTDENEMMSEASSPFVNSIPHINHGNEIDPRIISNSNVKDFLENLRSSVSDILNSDIDDDNKNVNSEANSKYLKQPQKFNFKEPSLKLSESKNVDVNKNYYKPVANPNGINLRKSNGKLNSYKAKVAIPDNLNMKTLPPLRNTEPSYFQRLLDDTIIRPPSNILRDPLQIPRMTSLKPLQNIINYPHPFSNLKQSYHSGEILPSSGSFKAFSEKLKSQTEETIDKIHDVFDTSLRKGPLGNDNNIFGETLTKPVIFGSISKTNNDFSKKLQDFNKKLIDRLNVSPRIPLPENSLWKTKHTINDLGDRYKSNLQTKSEDTLKSKKRLPIKTYMTVPRREGIPKPLLRQISDPRLNSDSIKNSKLGQELKFKPSLIKDIRRKPLKESKITFSFTTTSIRPPMIKPGLTSLQSPINLPKRLPLKTAAQKKLELKSKLKPGEQHSLASERHVSKASLPGIHFNKPLTTSLSEEKIENAHVKDLSEETDATKKSASSRLRESLNFSTLNGNKQNNFKSNAFADTAPSASNNNNLNVASISTSIEKPLKENVSYRCKMVCFEDTMNSK